MMIKKIIKSILMFSIYKICGVLVMQVSCSGGCCIGISPVNPNKEIAAQIVGSSSLTHYGIQQEESQIPVSSKHNLPWTLVDNKWWCYGPFKVFCYSTDIKVVNDDLDNIYRCYADCVKNECKDNDGNIVTEGYEDSKIVIDVSNLTQSSYDTYEERQEALETSTARYVRYLNTNNIPLTFDVLEELIDAISKTDGHDWVYYDYLSDEITEYLGCADIINGQVNLDYFCAGPLVRYLRSIISVVSRYEMLN